MRKALALAAVLSLLGGCADGESADDVADELRPDSDSTGYLLPRERPADCEFASGRFDETSPRPSYGAVLSPSDLDPKEVIDSIQVIAGPSEKDREVSADEAQLNEEREVGGRTVRIAKVMESITVDWWEDGWLVGVTAADRHDELAIETAAGLTPPPKGGKPEDTKVRVPDGLTMVADFTDRRTSANYTITTSRCGDREPKDVAMIASFIEGDADPRVLGLPGRIEKRTDGGRDYWVNTERGAISWTEGPAIVAVVTASDEPELLFEHVRSLRPVSREEFEAWIDEAEKEH